MNEFAISIPSESAVTLGQLWLSCCQTCWKVEKNTIYRKKSEKTLKRIIGRHMYLEL